MYGRLKAGVSEIEITGRNGLKLAGRFSPVNAVKVKTPLFAKALILSNDETVLAIITLDLIGLGRKNCERICDAVKKETSISPECIMISCSHTHASPCTIPYFGCEGIEEEYVEEVILKVSETVKKSLENLQNASLGAGSALLPHIIYNRRFITRNMKVITHWMDMPIPKNEVYMPEGPIDPELSVLVLRNAEGYPLCLLWNFAGHNVFSVGDQYSADLPYYVQNYIDNSLGKHIPVMYLPGCGGNINFNGDIGKVTEWISNAIVAVQLDTPCDPNIYLGSKKEEIVLPIRDYSQFWSEFDIKLKFPQVLETYRQELEFLRKEGANAVATYLQALRIGNFALAGLPGEPFVEFELEIKKRSPFLRTFVAGYTNDYPGYIITRRAFEYEGYESWTSRLAKIGPGGGEYLVTRTLILMENLAKEAPLSRKIPIKAKEEMLGSLADFDESF
jgi:hypothetical protein